MNQNKDFPNFVKIAVNVGYYQILPYVFTVGNDTKYFLDAAFISLLSEKLSFDFELIEPVDGQHGSASSDGVGTGVIGMLQRGEADIAIAKLSYTEKRASIVDFTKPYQYIPKTFITDNPRYVPDRYALLHPFSPIVWTAITLSLVLMPLVSTFFKMKKCSFFTIMYNIVGGLLEQSVNLKFRKLSSKVLIFAWVVGAMFISYSYKAVLLSFVTFPSLTGIKNIAELSKATEKSSFRCSTYTTTYVYSEILDTGPQSWKNIGKCIIQTNAYTTDVESFLQPTSYRKAFLGTKSHLESFHKSYYISDDAFFTDLFCIAVRKSFCCKDALDKAIVDLAAVGLLDKILKDENFFMALSVNDGGIKEQSRRILSLDDFFGAFFILLCGYISALVAFISEVILNKIHK